MPSSALSRTLLPGSNVIHNTIEVVHIHYNFIAENNYHKMYSKQFVMEQNTSDREVLIKSSSNVATEMLIFR